MARTILLSPTWGTVAFDAVFHLDHHAEAVLTEHPVQSGAPVSDHAFVKPSALTIEVGMTDAIEGGSAGRSASAFQMFMDLLELKEPLRIVTRLKTYDNMVVTSVSAPDDKATMNGLRAMIAFREVIMVDAATVSVHARTSAAKPSAAKKKKKNVKASKSGAAVKKSVSTKKLTAAHAAKKKKILGR